MFVIFKKLIPIFVIVVLSIFGYIFYNKNNYIKGNVIKIGQISSFSGLNKKIAKEFNLGIKAYFSYINDKGGVYERKIKLISLDDKDEPDLAQINAKKLKDEIVAYFGVTDLCSSKRILEMEADKNTPFIMPYCSANFLEQNHKDIYYSFTKSHEDEIETLINYFSKKGIKRVAVFYENDFCGKYSLNIAKKILRKYHLSITTAASCERNTLSIDEAYKKIAKYEPQVLLMFASYRQIANFLKRADNSEKYLDTIFMTTSCAGIDAIKEGLGNSYNGNLIVTETIFSPYEENIPLVKEYQNVLRSYFPNAKFNYESLKGFLYAKIFVLALEEAGFNLSGQLLLKSLKNIPYIKYNKEYLIKVINDNNKLSKIYLLHYKDNNFTLLN